MLLLIFLKTLALKLQWVVPKKFKKYYNFSRMLPPQHCPLFLQNKICTGSVLVIRTVVPAVDNTSNPSRILLEKPSFRGLFVVTAPLFRKFGNRVVKIVGKIEVGVIVGGGVVVSILLVVVGIVVVVVVLGTAVVVVLEGLLVVVVGSNVVDDNSCNDIFLG